MCATVCISSGTLPYTRPRTSGTRPCIRDVRTSHAYSTCSPGRPSPRTGKRLRPGAVQWSPTGSAPKCSCRAQHKMEGLQYLVPSQTRSENGKDAPARSCSQNLRGTSALKMDLRVTGAPWCTPTFRNPSIPSLRPLATLSQGSRRLPLPRLSLAPDNRRHVPDNRRHAPDNPRPGSSMPHITGLVSAEATPTIASCLQATAPTGFTKVSGIAGPKGVVISTFVSWLRRLLTRSQTG